MNELLLRQADTGDFRAICGLASGPDEMFLAFPAARWPLTPKQLHRIAERRSDLTVACLGSSIAGFANLYEIRPSQSAWIGNLIIAGHYRRQGIAGNLLRYMLDLIFNGYDLAEARLSVFENNPAARALYREAGFRQYGSERRADRQQRPVTMLHMRLERDSPRWPKQAGNT